MRAVFKIMHTHRISGSRAPMMLLAFALLGSCSYGYDVRAVAINGKLAFVSTDADWDCVANIDVSTDQTTAKPLAGDDRLLVVNGGAFWATHNPVIECTMDFPLLYGAGGPKVRTSVAPKKLKFDVLYTVSTEGEGAYGNGCFRINAERRIENLPYNSCFDADGSSEVLEDA